jgi:hypothetical protein
LQFLHDGIHAGTFGSTPLIEFCVLARWRTTHFPLVASELGFYLAYYFGMVASWFDILFQLRNPQLRAAKIQSLAHGEDARGTGAFQIGQTKQCGGAIIASSS